MSDLVDQHRDKLPMHEHMVTMDPPAHTRERALTDAPITPKRLKDNEAFMWRLADQQLDAVTAEGRCEFIGAYAQPFAMLVVADLLGVPEADHERFREGFGLTARPARSAPARRATPARTRSRGSTSGSRAYVEDRRREPRADVLTHLALATYPDGSTPEVTSVVRTADLPVRRRSGDHRPPARLGAEVPRRGPGAPGRRCGRTASRIPDFIEEALRMESPVKADFRLARRPRRSAASRSRPARRSCS